MPLPVVERHSWNLTPTEAIQLQRELAAEVDVSSPLPPWKTVAAVDGSYDRGGSVMYGAIVLVDAESFALIERVGIAAPLTFPYVPGLLSFREAPVLIEAFSRLNHRPDVILCDAQGLAHPRRLGLACHLGLWLDVPTIGCAKSRLCGTFDELGPKRGDRSALVDQDDVVGAVVRTRDRVAPVFVSPGHRCDLEGAVSVVMATTRKYRLPVPARMAHEHVNDVRRAVAEGRPIPA
jgi:deoxyribonuclease V